MSERAEPPSLGLGPLSRVRLDELLQEMLDRVGDVMASRERLRALLDVTVGDIEAYTHKPARLTS